ncbi:PREDICTED: uncharacterized protein LOC104598279 isoform X2 [Nelumbo nucifera]|uniref:Uncharacterized protein n=2 Tax=Nelumbo nucifera TaxID=4432 RepID=A0A822YR05_NELNU|nr:PREDICTED: uncharacterized protein LOC104598279 isoform X2 [Nelumbo nucifera]DAD34947.1 TPA_asm: hypothetical protein HUJ06_005587 [Nelumbo nucifera]
MEGEGRGEISRCLKDWEQFQHLPPHSSSFPNEPQVLSVSEARTEAQAYSAGWEMVVLRQASYDDDCIIFPPSKHEGLHVSILNYQHQEEVKSEPNPSLSRLDVDIGDPQSQRQPFDSRLRTAEYIVKRLRFMFEILQSKIFRIIFLVRTSCTARRRRAWPFASSIAVAATLFLSLLYWWVPHRNRRLRRDKLDHLILLIKNQDEISQLLYQIAQINEALSAHHKVPLHRIG